MSGLAPNLKVTIRKLWPEFGNLRNPGYQSNVTPVSSGHSKFQKLNHCGKNQPKKSTFSFQETNNKNCENSKRTNASATLSYVRLRIQIESWLDS